MGSRFDQNPDPSFVIEPDPISEQRWPDDGRRCRGEPPLRGGHFFKSLQPLGCCSNLWGDCLAFGMLVEPLGCLSSRWDVDRRYILADAAVAANRRFAAHNFLNPCNLWDVVLTFGELV